MGTYVITGGTDGMGRALALRLLQEGNHVISVASGERKGTAFLQDVRLAGGPGTAEFLQADLSTIAGCQEVVEYVTTSVDDLDGVVFGAQRFQSRRVETTDGLEFTFALAYLSRFLLGHGLRDHLERGTRPVIMNIAGPGGIPGQINWADLQHRDSYTGMRASMQASRGNDLLGVEFAARYPDTRIRYLLHNPGFVRTAMADPLPQPMRALTKTLAVVFATSASTAAQRISALMADPPAEPVSAFMRRRRLPLDGPAFDPDTARRLHEVTRELIAAYR